MTDRFKMLTWLYVTSLMSMVSCHYFIEKAVRGRKRDETEKGVLTSDPFIDASHFWPFQSSHFILSPDLVTGSNTVLINGASIKNDTFFKTGLDLHGKKSYVIVGDFKGTCFSDPGECTLGGMTVYFWLKINSSDIKKDQDQYILSSGGQSKNARGFAFLNFHGEYVAVVSTKTMQWKLVFDKLKLDSWIQITLVWSKSDNDLSFYLNGVKQASVKGVKSDRPVDNHTILTIGRPNNAINEEFMMPFSLAYLALWDKPLNQNAVTNGYKNIKMMMSGNSR